MEVATRLCGRTARSVRPGRCSGSAGTVVRVSAVPAGAPAVTIRCSRWHILATSGGGTNSAAAAAKSGWPRPAARPAISAGGWRAESSRRAGAAPAPLATSANQTGDAGRLTHRRLPVKASAPVDDPPARSLSAPGGSRDRPADRTRNGVVAASTRCRRSQLAPRGEAADAVVQPVPGATRTSRQPFEVSRAVTPANPGSRLTVCRARARPSAVVVEERWSALF